MSMNIMHITIDKGYATYQYLLHADNFFLCVASKIRKRRQLDLIQLTLSATNIEVT